MRPVHVFVLAGLFFASASAQPVWVQEPAVELSATPTGGFDGEWADGAKLIRLAYKASNGAFEKPLVSVYVDAQGPAVWLFDGTRRPARDVFVTRSLDGGLSWSTPVNLSATAALSSMMARQEAGMPPQPYYGDSASPMVHANGKNVLISWMDRHCPDPRQRVATYPDQGGLEVPYACLHEVRSRDGGSSWTTPRRLSSGERDAWRNASFSSPAGFAIVWQEDPQGLQPGEGEGPGEGGSGARVSPGSDVWYAGLSAARFGAGEDFPPPRRISDNFTRMEGDPGGAHESGETGASRPQVTLIGQSAVIVYEETKGPDSTGGKYIRYHWFPAFSEPISDPTGGAGCILSDPLENSRRARLIGQPSPLRLTSDSQLLVLWRQGATAKGGPADIVGRIGYRNASDPLSDGLRVADFSPPPDPGCTSPTTGGAAPLNFSSAAGLGSPTDLNPIENARAHRAVARGDTWLIAYVYTPNWNLAENSDLENYDVYVRRSFDGGRTWDSARNVTRLPKPISAAEPRLVSVPFSPDPSDQSNPLVYFLAWVEESAGGSGVRFTRTTDAGESYASPIDLALGVAVQGEPQIRSAPDGQQLFSLWLEMEPQGSFNSRFRTSRSPFSLLDANSDGQADALTDGVLILRKFFGFKGDSLIKGTISPGALRREAETVESYLERITERLDIDGDGHTDALTDGLLILRYLFGFRGDSLIKDAIGAGAARREAPEIEGYLGALG